MKNYRETNEEIEDNINSLVLHERNDLADIDVDIDFGDICALIDYNSDVDSELLLDEEIQDFFEESRTMKEVDGIGPTDQSTFAAPNGLHQNKKKDGDSSMAHSLLHVQIDLSPEQDQENIEINPRPRNLEMMMSRTQTSHQKLFECQEATAPQRMIDYLELKKSINLIGTKRKHTTSALEKSRNRLEMFKMRCIVEKQKMSTGNIKESQKRLKLLRLQHEGLMKTKFDSDGARCSIPCNELLIVGEQKSLKEKIDESQKRVQLLRSQRRGLMENKLPKRVPYSINRKLTDSIKESQNRTRMLRSKRQELAATVTKNSQCLATSPKFRKSQVPELPRINLSVIG